MSGSYVALAVGVNSLTGGAITDALGMGPSGGGGSVGGGSGSGAQAAADPFAPYRANLGSLYSGMLTGSTPTDVTKMPGYTQFQTGVLDPALEASKRSASASGMLRSGNEQIALEKTAEKGYYGFMTDYLNRLAQGSGAVNNPAQAAALGVNQGNLNDSSFMQGLGATATALKGIYGGSSSGYSATDTSYMPVSTFNGSGDASWMSDPWM
jgi:hypothetical protein